MSFVEWEHHPVPNKWEGLCRWRSSSSSGMTVRIHTQVRRYLLGLKVSSRVE